MKKVVLIRHAKSRHDDFSGVDFERPLTAKGIFDSVKMAKWLHLQNLNPELIYTSPARRALDTAKIFRQELGLSHDNFLSAEELYEPVLENFYHVIQDTSQKVQTMIIVSHNPGVTQLANDLNCYKEIYMSTASLFGFESDDVHWNNFQTSEKSFLFFREA